VLTIFPSLFLFSEHSPTFPCTYQGSYEFGNSVCVCCAARACSCVRGCGLLDLLSIRGYKRRSLAPGKLMCWRAFAHMGALIAVYGLSEPVLDLVDLLCTCVVCR
jgi:hypothetical protein